MRVLIPGEARARARRGWTTAPGSGVLGVRIVSRATGTSLVAVLQRGLRVHFSCPAACRPSWRLEIPASEARRLGLGRRRFTAGRAVFGRTATSGSVRIELSRRARRALRRARRVQLNLTMVVDGRIVATHRVKLVLRTRPAALFR